MCLYALRILELEGCTSMLFVCIVCDIGRLGLMLLPGVWYLRSRYIICLSFMDKDGESSMGWCDNW